MNTRLKVVSVRKIVAFALMSDAGILEVRRGATALAFINTRLKVASVCEIVEFRLMSDAGVLEVRRGAKKKERREIAGN